MTSTNIRRIFASIAIVCLFLARHSASAQQTIRVVVAGLNHDHIHGILQEYKKGHVEIVSIVEPDKSLRIKYGKLYKLPDSLFAEDLKTVVLRKKPDAVLGYNAVGRHLDIVEICAPLGIPVMVEKPLAATLEQARRMEELAGKYHIPVLTNYETTWYPSCREVLNMVTGDSLGEIKKIVAHDGHQGPKEIGCSPEFLNWLTDPVLNGAGAMNDFGCYGAVLMTWLMKGQRPVAVTAIARHYKPAIYPRVEDDATIIVEYPRSTGLIEASWNWPFSIKDLEVFGEHGYVHALDNQNLAGRMRENIKWSRTAAPLDTAINSQISYLTAILSRKISGEDDMCSLKYNMIMMQILDAAKRSAATGKRVTL